MLKKFELVNVPEGGVRHPVGHMGLVEINDQLTDEQAEMLIKAGLGHYFKPVEENGEATSPVGPIDESSNPK